MSKEQGFIEATRKVRNTYAHNAHNIQYVDVSLIELIKQRTDKSHLLKNLSAIKNYDEADSIAAHEKDRGFFWFGIIDSTMRFLFSAYHIAAAAKELGVARSTLYRRMDRLHIVLPRR